MAYRVARCAIWTRRLKKKGPPLINSASGCSLARAAKAVSISVMVLALKTRICKPPALAAPSKSLRLAAAIVGSAGLRSTAMRFGGGHKLTQEFQPLACQLGAKKVDSGQVATGPRDAGDKTEPDRVFGNCEDNRDRCGCPRRGDRSRRANRHDHFDLSANKVGGVHHQPVRLVLGPAIFDN